MKYSIVIPAYNEEANLNILIEEFVSLIKQVDIEVIIVNNASTDNSSAILNIAKKNHKFLRLVNLDVNEGYGNGIKQGLLIAQGEYVGWMHADLQNDIKDIFKAIELLDASNNPTKIYVKGLRKKMNPVAAFFTVGMAIFATILFNEKLYDINAQPNLFNKNLLIEANIEKAPKGGLFDLYFYYYALKKGYTILRFNSEYKKRLRGASFWNRGILSRIKLSLDTIKESIKLKRIIDNGS